MPQKRHDAFLLFSRDHHTGLVLAMKLLSAFKNPKKRHEILKEFLHAWHAELQSHFSEEERLLFRYMKASDIKRMKTDHEAIRTFANKETDRHEDLPNKERFTEIGQTLKDHIRWEERYLFPTLENSMTTEQLKTLEEETSLIETTRPRSQKQY